MKILLAVLTITLFSSCLERSSPNKKADLETIQDTTDMEPSIFFHEDDYCQVQLSLKENLTQLQKEAEEILGFAKEHFDGSGFTDIKVREEETHKLVLRQIKKDDIEAIIIHAGFDKIPKVFTGYGQTYKEELENTHAYGKNGCAIFFDHKDTIVEHIWLEYHWGNEVSDKDKFAICLRDLGKKWNLLLMDWNQLKLVELTDSLATQKYLNER